MQAPIDDAEWPLVKVRWDGFVSDTMVDTFLAKMDEWLERGERFGLLLDSRGAKGMSPEQRTRLIEHMKQNAESTAKHLAQAIVLDNFIQRTLFYGINLIFPNPFPSKLFVEPEPALVWLRGQLGLPPPLEVR
jgi:hypothetical protein